MSHIYSRPEEPGSGPVPYMQRLTDYYLALGYGNPYKWAHHSETPFMKPKKSLKDSRVGIITTAAPFKSGAGDQGPGAPYNAAAKFYKVYSHPSSKDQFLGISHLGYDRSHSTAEDINSFFPMRALVEFAQAGKIRDVSPRYYGAPTNRSQETTIKVDCEAILKLVTEDEVDLAILVAN